MANSIFGEDTAQQVWDSLHNCTVDEEGYIDEEFYTYPIGTEVTDIWHDMEDVFNITVGEMRLSPL
jgi:hypothetical protein